MITSIKKITTKPAYNILECDGENLQAKIAASMSDDPALRELFISGGDFHSNNAYQMMAKYQTFTPYQVTYSDNSTSLIMEWKSFDVERAHHVGVKDLQAGDKVEGKEVVSVKPLDPIKISADEYRENAKQGRLKDIRTIAKFCGFGFLFGSAAMTFANGTLRMEWTPKRCEAFIDEYKLEDLKHSLIKRYTNLSESDIAYLTVASFFRAEFFKMYPVLEKWIEEQGKKAARQGYIRSPWGARRLLPQLTYQGEHSDKREIKNLSNIAVNSPVQDYEVEYMSKAMVAINEDFEKYGFLSYIAGTVHDSVVPFTFLPEQNQVLKILLSHFAVDHSAAKGIPYSGECNVAEVSKGEIWGYGSREVKLKDVENVEIEHLDYFN